MFVSGKGILTAKFHEPRFLSLDCSSCVVSLNFCVSRESYDGDLLCAFCFFISYTQQ